MRTTQAGLETEAGGPVSTARDLSNGEMVLTTWRIGVINGTQRLLRRSRSTQLTDRDRSWRRANSGWEHLRAQSACSAGILWAVDFTRSTVVTQTGSGTDGIRV